MGVVVDRGHFGGNTVLVTTEIDEAVQALVATTAVAAGDHTTIVASFAAVFGHHQGAFRLAAGDFTEVGDHPGAGTGGVGAESTNCHDDSDPSGLREELDGVALGQAHHCLLHLGTLAGETADTTTPARRVHGADARDLDIEELLDCSFDVWLGGSSGPPQRCTGFVPEHGWPFQ